MLPSRSGILAEAIYVNLNEEVPAASLIHVGSAGIVNAISIIPFSSRQKIAEVFFSSTFENKKNVSKLNS